MNGTNTLTIAGLRARRAELVKESDTLINGRTEGNEALYDTKIDYCMDEVESIDKRIAQLQGNTSNNIKRNQVGTPVGQTVFMRVQRPITT